MDLFTDHEYIFLMIHKGPVPEKRPAEFRRVKSAFRMKSLCVSDWNFRRAGKEDKITLIEGDATEVLAEMEGTFDFIFMDAAKGQYIHFLPEVLRLLKKGGLLVSDNVLQDGDIIESRFAVTRRNRTIYSRMRDYLWQLKHMKEFETAVLTVGDGVTISTKLTE